MVTLTGALKIAGVFIAVILGAGFASGQELLSFFVVFGKAGFLGIVLSGAIFALVGWAVLDLCLRLNIKSYSEFAGRVMGRFLGLFMESVIACFLFVLFATMLAASGAAASEAFDLPFWSGSAAMAVACVLCFLGDLKRVMRVSLFLAPVMVLGGLFIGLFSFFADTPVFLHLSALRENNWIVSAVTYASYNIITTVSVLVPLAASRDAVPSPKAALWGSVMGGAVIAALGIIMSLPLLTNYFSLSGFELPLLKITMAHGKLIQYIYLLVFITAMFTTALANGFAFIEWLTGRFPLPALPAKIFVAAAAVMVSQVGFSNFVGKIYPLFGYLGLFQILVILLVYVQVRRKQSQ